MTDYSNLIEQLALRASRKCADGYAVPFDSDLDQAAASALSSQSLSLSEAREEIERLKGLVAGIRECPQEPAKVAADDPVEGNWFNHRSLLPSAPQEHWLDIATAPKDGTEILLYGHGVLRSGGVYAKGRHVGWSQLARDGRTYWATRDPAVDCEPTHWMQLPTPPSALEFNDDRE